MLTSLQSDVGLLAKQSDLLATFRRLVDHYGIRIHINEPFPEVQEPISVDVEHNESGELVVSGLYILSDNSYYGFSDIVALSKLDWSSLELIAHNGVGDLDCLKLWGCKTDDAKLVWDTMLMGHILDSSLKAYGLKDMSKRELGIEYPDYDAIVGIHRKKTKKSPACPRLQSDCCDRITLDKQPFELSVLYNAMDCFVTAKLYERQLKNECLSFGILQ